VDMYHGVFAVRRQRRTVTDSPDAEELDDEEEEDEDNDDYRFVV